ncbi:MAG: DUF4070 domain-containing protein [Bdellovibrionota bacterium]
MKTTRALLVHARFPVTYWGFQYCLSLAGRKAALPPLGLLSLAALLPDSWDLRLVDLNIQRLSKKDLEWAEVVLVSGMRVQSDSMREVVRRAKELGRRTAVGGPAPTTAPQDFAEADVILRGEAESVIPELLAAMESKERCVISPPALPGLDRVPVPRYDLVDVKKYASLSIQFSRGCPFNCEFCDVIEIYGRVPRTKSPEQVLSELECMYGLGYRGSVFFVDDNFVGNRAAVRRLLPELIRWQQERGYPFELYTEASVNLAADGELVQDMVAAGFSAVFLGIETPSAEALAAAGKKQNLAMDPKEAVERLTRAGLEVMGGFIVGFDSDTPETLKLQKEFISNSPIPMAMVGLLTALPGTALWKRLEREGRLRKESSGDQFGRPNFAPAMNEEELLSGYAKLLGEIYSPKEYYRRCWAQLEKSAPPPGGRKLALRDMATFFRTSVRVGMLSTRAVEYWGLLVKTLRDARHAFPSAVAHAVKGEHLIAYTRKEVLPRIEAALEKLREEQEKALAPLSASFSPA